MTSQFFKPHRKLGSLSAGAFAALLLLTTAAPQASAEISKQHQNDSSEATSGSSSGSSRSSSGSSSGSSGGGYVNTSNSDRGSRGEGGRSGGGDRGGRGGGDRGGRGGDHGGRGGDHGRGGRGGGWHSDGRGHGGGYSSDRGRGRHWGGHRGHGGYRHYRGGYYGGWGGYYGGYGGWGGWWPWWYPHHGPTVIIENQYRYGGSGSGALDLDVTPENAQIFVDGEYVGRADDYDGFPTFLWLERGTYDVAIFHEGYETIVRQYTVRPGALIDVEDRMREGTAIPPEQLMTPKSTEVRDARIQRNAEQEAAVDRAEAEDRDYDEDDGDDEGSNSDQRVGRLLLSLWPPDAAIYLDGHFLGTAEEIGRLSAGLVVEPGEHELEVVRPGFGTIKRNVNVPAGEKTEVKLELNKN